MTKSVLGVIGGSGVYDMAMDDSHWVAIASPWGETSDEFRIGTIHGIEVVFLPRHGRGHRHPAEPDRLPRQYRCHEARRGAPTWCRSRPAARSVRTCAPGIFVIVDQFIDRTFAREKSFFGDRLRRACVAGRADLAASGRPRRGGSRGRSASRCQRGGTYLCMEGPQFSTIAEVEALPLVGLRRDRHDQHAGGQARPRGGALLRDGGDGHRFRLLAPRPRHGRHPVDPRGGAGQFRQCRAAASAEIASNFPRRARAMPDRLRPGARTCDHHRPGQARSTSLLRKLDAVAGRVLNR